METIATAELINLLFVLAVAAAGAGFMAGLLGVGVELLWFQHFIMLLLFWILISSRECIFRLEHHLQ